MRLTAFLSTALFVAATLVARAADLPVSDFYGTWQSSGLVENADDLYFAMTEPDIRASGDMSGSRNTVSFDVAIARDGQGFAVTWSAVIQRADDPANNPRLRIDGELVFEPSERAGVFEATNSGFPLDGDVLSWATVEENTLTIHQMVVFESGGFQLNTFHRTLTESGMEQVFQRLLDGEPMRSGTVHLIKTAG